MISGSIPRLDPDPIRQTHVESQTQRLGKLIQELHQQINTVEERLSSVTQPIPPSNQADGKPSEVLVPHAMKLLEIGDAIEVAITRLRSLENRLEIT